MSTLDARERMDDPEELLRTALEAHQAKMWTSLPGKVVKVNWAEQTMTVQPMIKSRVMQEDGTVKSVSMPPLQDVPFQNPSGGGATISMPVKAGDEVLVTFSSRSPDGWQQSGNESASPDSSMHGLSGGFAMLGFKSKPEAAKITSPDPDALEIRSNDGQQKISLKPGGDVKLKNGANTFALSSSTGCTITGDINFQGGTVKHNGHDIGETHKHINTQPGGGISGIPQ